MLLSLILFKITGDNSIKLLNNILLTRADLFLVLTRILWVVLYLINV